MSNFPFI